MGHAPPPVFQRPPGAVNSRGRGAAGGRSAAVGVVHCAEAVVQALRLVLLGGGAVDHHDALRHSGGQQSGSGVGAEQWCADASLMEAPSMLQNAGTESSTNKGVLPAQRPLCASQFIDPSHPTAQPSFGPTCIIIGMGLDRAMEEPCTGQGHAGSPLCGVCCPGGTR